MAEPSPISHLIQRLEAWSVAPQTPIPPPPSRSPISSPSTAAHHDPSWPQDPAARSEAVTQLAQELMALQSIYTDEALRLLRIVHHSPSSAHPSAAEYESSTGRACSSASSLTSSAVAAAADPQDWQPGSRITLALSTEIEPRDPSASTPETIPLRIAITLPAFYPLSSKPPQLQLLSKYVGGYGVDHSLFGVILRAFYHHKDHDPSNESGAAAEPGISEWIGGSMSQGVNWVSGEVILFEGIEWVKEKVSDWWIERERARLSNANGRGFDARQDTGEDGPGGTPNRETVTKFDELSVRSTQKSFKGEIVTAEAITDRKSVFVGYAARISHPDEVPEVLQYILSDRRVAKAAHPTINAWVCQTEDGIVHRDCDDDGESAAGGRLAHLLSLLEVTNTLVVVTRWFGGIHLGADRFKLINRAARDALELAGMVPGPLNPAPGGGGNLKAESKAGKGMGKRF